MAKAKQGEFVKGVKGMAAVYAFQVVSEKKGDAKLDDAAKQSTRSQIANQQLSAASRFMQELYQRASVKDNRYIFY